MTREISEPGKLLDETGMLRGSCWSRSPLLIYERESVPVWRRLFRLREWDTYVFGSSDVQSVLTVADCGMFGIISATVFRLDRECGHSESVLLPFTLGALDMPESVASGDITYRSGRIRLDFGRSPGKRYLRFQMDEFDDVRPLYVTMCLEDSVSAVCCLAEPHEKVTGGFRHDCRVTAMPSAGTILYGGDRYELSLSDSCGGLYHGRGVLPTGSERIWGILQGLTDDGTAGVSLSGSRAFIVHNGQCELVEGVSMTGFDMAMHDAGRQITISSADSRLWMSFTPSVSQSGRRRLLGHTIFGRDAVCGSCIGEMRFGRGICKVGNLRGVICLDRCV